MPVLTKINTNSIAEDAITGDKFAGDAYLSNTANQNISGTYSENRLYTSDAYTLSANATVNSHLTLSSIKPTDDVVLTAGGAYTLDGSGVLSGGSLLAKANTNLTGMTGALGSAVTQATGYTLGSGVTFPAGHIVQVKQSRTATTTSVTSTTTIATKVENSITVTSGNNVLVTSIIPIRMHSDAGGYIQARFYLYHGTDGNSYSELGGYGGDIYKDQSGNLPADFWHSATMQIIYLHENVSGINHFYKIYFNRAGSGTVSACSSGAFGTMLLQEVQT